MFILSEGALLSPMRVDDQNAYRRRWGAALIGVEMTHIVYRGSWGI